MKKKALKAVAVMLGITLLTGCGANSGEVNDATVFESEQDSESDVTAANVSEDTEETTAEDTKETTAENTNSGDRANATLGTGEKKELSVGDTAPDFTIDLKGGSTFTLSDYDDKVVLLNFWATWCGPCQGEMPAFEKLKSDGYADLEILCIDIMEERGVVESFIDELGYTFNIGFDDEGKIAEYYPTDGIPYTLVINKGVISKVYVGAYDWETQYKEYKSAIDECLN